MERPFALQFSVFYSIKKEIPYGGTMKQDTIYTKADLLRQLAALNIPRDRVVIVHTALRLIGQVEGGAQTILDTLIEYFTTTGGLLCIPAHTWDNLGKQEITLDMTDPHTSLGAFSDFAAADPRGIRSENPTHSVVVFGDREKANAFIAKDTQTLSGTGPDSCYSNLYHQKGFILLIGVSQTANTYLHTVDEMLGMPNRVTAELHPVAVKRPNGEIVQRQLKMHDTDYHPDICVRFPKYETPFRYYGAITDGFFGNAPVQACDAVIMKEVMELILKNHKGKDPLEKEWPFPPSAYCKEK